MRRLLLVVAVCACRTSPVQKEPLPLPPAQPAELRKLTSENATAGALAVRAEAALAAGRIEEAATEYTKAAAAAPRTALAHRRQCELLTRLAHRDDALKACNLAMQWGGSARELRATVGAIVSVPRTLTLDEVVSAHMLAAGATSLLPGQPDGHAATADIARRIGNQEMLLSAVAELQRIAPDHYETRRAMALMPRSWNWLRALGWLALAVAISLSARRAFAARRGTRPALEAAVPAQES